MIFNSFLINEFLFLPNRNQMVLLFPVKEYNTEVKGTIQPILYSSISIRWQILYVSNNYICTTTSGKKCSTKVLGKSCKSYSSIVINFSPNIN